MSQTNPAFAAALAVFDAINSGDFARLGDYVTADFVDHGAPFPLPPGPEGYRQVLGFVHEVLQIRYTIDDAFATSDRVVVRATARGVGLDGFFGEGAAGGTYAMTTVHIYRTEAGRLAEHWGVRDEVAARVQLGTLEPPTPPRQVVHSPR
jgi:predicted ester cyclase